MSATNKQQTVVENVREIVTMFTYKPRISASRVNLGLILRQMPQTLAPSLRSKGIELRLALPEGDLWVRAELVSLRHHVLIPLVENAVKHSLAEGSVLIKVQAGADSLQIDVVDQGPGMSQEQVAELFVPFLRENDEDLSGSNTLGFGMAIAKNYIEQYGGSIRVTSSVRTKKRTQSGSTVSIFLPRAKAPQRARLVQAS
jgi:two-component system sensor histidine kinase GlrK